MFVPFPLMTGTTLSRNLLILTFGGGGGGGGGSLPLALYFKADGRNNTLSILSD